MISFRRYLLDELLEKNQPNFSGRILDIGGQRKKVRGNFRFSKELEGRRTVLNISTDVGADIVCTLPEIKAEDESFETLLMMEVIEYIEDLPTLKTELARVLKKGGSLFISVPYIHALHGDDESDYYRLSESFLKKFFSDKFEVISFQRMGGMVAVITDLVWAQAARYPSFCLKILSKFLKVVASVLKVLDQFFAKKNKFVTTGYWLHLRKK